MAIWNGNLTGLETMCCDVQMWGSHALASKFDNDSAPDIMNTMTFYIDSSGRNTEWMTARKTETAKGPSYEIYHKYLHRGMNILGQEWNELSSNMVISGVNKEDVAGIFKEFEDELQRAGNICKFDGAHTQSYYGQYLRQRNAASGGEPGPAKAKPSAP